MVAAVVEHADRAVGCDLDLDRPAGRGMADGVLDQVAHGAEQRLGMAEHPHRLLAAAERDHLRLRNRDRRHEGDGLGADLLEIGAGVAGDDEAFELGDIEHLVDEVGCLLEVGAQRVAQRAGIHRIDAGADDGERRAQLVRHVGGELALGTEALLEAIERLVDGAHQRHDLGRHRRFRQAHLGAGRADRGGRGRRLAHRLQGAAEDHDVDQQQRQQQRKGDPRHAGKERGDDVVDDDVAMRQVLRDLDDVGPTVDIALHADAEQHRSRAAPAHRPVAGARLLGREQRGAVIARGEQHAARRVEHGIGVQAVAAGIERLHLRRNVERDAVTVRPQEAADRHRLAAQRVAVQAVGRFVEQPVQRQRHHDRDHADRHDMQGDDAGDDGVETLHALPTPVFSSAIR